MVVLKGILVFRLGQRLGLKTGVLAQAEQLLKKVKVLYLILFLIICKMHKELGELALHQYITSLKFVSPLNIDPVGYFEILHTVQRCRQ